MTHHDYATLDRIIAVECRGQPPTDAQLTEAHRLLVKLLHAAEPFGLKLKDFDWVVDLPAACVHVILSKDRRSS